MARMKGLAKGVAVAAVASLSLAACSGGSEGEESSSSSSGESSGGTIKIGSLLPSTGSLAYLGPPEIAGVNLGVTEINEAGGVLGQTLEAVHEDSSDTDNPQITSQSVTSLLNEGVAVIVGAASSGVTFNVIDDIVNAGVVMFSPANTSTGLSGYSDLYYRTAPPDTVQGNALANLMLEDGAQDVGILVFNDDYGTSLRDVVQETVEAAGGSITYGTSGQEFDTAASSFSTEVQAVLATDPDVIAIIAFDQTKSIIPELISAGWEADKIYMVDGNTADYSADFDEGTLEGAKGTIPGAYPNDEFKARLDEANGSELDDYAYGAESYDAVILSALAAVKGGSWDSQTIADNLHAVSGTDGGTECSAYAECVELIEAGEEIAYQTVSGAGPFNDANDPSSAYIGVYEYGADNIPVWVDAVFGEAPAE